jgi:hypothetical protein
MISEPTVRLGHTMHLSCTDTNIVSKQNEERFHMIHVTLEFHQVCQKQFLSQWYVRRKLGTSLASRLVLSPNGPSFHFSLVTSEYHRMRPKQFLTRWYVGCELCTYLAETLTLSPRGKKSDPTWPTPPRSSIGCVQNNFWAYGTSSANNAPVLHRN